MAVGSTKVVSKLIGWRAYSKLLGAIFRLLPFLLRQRWLFPLIFPPYLREKWFSISSWHQLMVIERYLSCSSTIVRRLLGLIASSWFLQNTLDNVDGSWPFRHSSSATVNFVSHFDWHVSVALSLRVLLVALILWPIVYLGCMECPCWTRLCSLQKIKFENFFRLN